MHEYILLMHDDAASSTAGDDPAKWETYITRLRATGQFDGGSSIGKGLALKKNAVSKPSAHVIGGYMRVRAESLEDAQQFLEGNPVYEAGARSRSGN